MRKDRFETEVLEVEIIKFNNKGEGVAEYKHKDLEEGDVGKRNLTVHIPYTVPGDIVQVTVPNAKGRRRAHLDYDKIIKPSPYRTHERIKGKVYAGGTPLQFMSYEGQLKYKTQMVKDLLEEQGFDPNLVKDIIGMDNPYHYRNKMDLTFGINGELGMHEPGNYQNVIDWEDNLIAPVVMFEIKEVISQWQERNKLKGYNKDERVGLLRNLLMRESKANGELMVAIFATDTLEEDSPIIKDLIESLTSKFDKLTSLLWIENKNIADRLDADRVTLLHGRDYIVDELCGYKYRLFHNTFFQPNPKQAEVMVETALGYADLNKDMRVLDLFCGVGTFSLPFAAGSKELAGVEIVEASIESAKRNASENGVDNTYFIARDAKKGIDEIKETWGIPDLVLLDPPRGGAGGKVMRRIGRLGSDKIVYVSCNPKTFVEDIVWLKDFGYELEEVQPIDQFSSSLHTELISSLVKA